MGGYVLPYGQMSHWRATVIINLLSIVSDTLVVWLWRGYVVSKFTLTRFYTLHFLLPLAMAVLLLRHLHLLHGTRGSSLSYAPVKLSFFPFCLRYLTLYTQQDIKGASFSCRRCSTNHTSLEVFLKCQHFYRFFSLYLLPTDSSWRDAYCKALFSTLTVF